MVLFRQNQDKTIRFLQYFHPGRCLIPGCYSHARHPIPEWFYVKNHLEKLCLDVSNVFLWRGGRGGEGVRGRERKRGERKGREGVIEN